MSLHFIKVKVTSDARKPTVVQKSSDSFAVTVREPAEQGRANRAMLAALAAHLGVPAGRMRIIKGAHAPAKILEIRDP